MGARRGGGWGGVAGRCHVWSVTWVTPFAHFKARRRHRIEIVTIILKRSSFMIPMLCVTKKVWTFVLLKRVTKFITHLRLIGPFLYQIKNYIFRGSLYKHRCLFSRPKESNKTKLGVIL